MHCWKTGLVHIQLVEVIMDREKLMKLVGGAKALEAVSKDRARLHAWAAAAPHSRWDLSFFIR
jgi:hypothetical protein